MCGRTFFFFLPPPHYFTLVPFSSYNLLTVFVKTCPALLTVHHCQLLNENNNDSLSLQGAKNDQNPGLYNYLFSMISCV